jgi:hypothetical protein
MAIPGKIIRIITVTMSAPKKGKTPLNMVARETSGKLLFASIRIKQPLSIETITISCILSELIVMSEWFRI